MTSNIQRTLEALATRLPSVGGQRNWELAAFAVENEQSQGNAPSLQCIAIVGAQLDPIVSLVAYAASVMQTTIIGDSHRLNTIGDLQFFSPLIDDTPNPRRMNSVKHGSVIGAPCIDPWQTVSPGQSLGKVVGVLAVWGELPPEEVIEKADLRYLVEEYSKAVASFLRPQFQAPSTYFHWPIPGVEIRPHGQSFGRWSTPAIRFNPRLRLVTDAVPSERTPFRIRILPTESNETAKQPQDVKPYKSLGEYWIQFGPGLTASTSGLEAFEQALSQWQTNSDYVKDFQKMPR